MSTGRLLQAYTKVTWGGQNLTAVDDGSGYILILANNVKVSFSNSSAPSMSFEFVPNPKGFETFSRLKEGSLTQLIEVELGYANLKSFTQRFQYVGMELTTGSEPRIRVETVGVLKGPFTDTRISYTMEEKIPLKELPDFILGKINPKPKIKITYTKEALEVIANAEHQENQLQRTGYSILAAAIRPYGLRIDPGSSAFADEVTISVAPDSTTQAQLSRQEQPKAGERRAHIVGPGLVQNLTRRQKFNIGQSSAKPGASKNNNVSTEQDQKEAQPPEVGAQQPLVGQAQSPTAVVGPANPQSTAESRSTGTTTDQAKKARVKETKLLTTELTFTAPMLPRFMAIQPRDFILIPSIKGPGEYIEDWEIDSVEYSQESSGQIAISVKANRPFTGSENIVSESVLAQAKAQVSALQTPEAWAAYYWGQ